MYMYQLLLYYIILLTEHDFIGGDNDVKLECICDDLPTGVPVVELVLIDESAAVDAAVVDDHIEVAPRLKLSLPVGDGGEGSYHQEGAIDTGSLHIRFFKRV